MGMVRCGMGEICGEGHGTSSAHWCTLSKSEMQQINEELAEMEQRRDVEDMMKDYYYEGGEYYLRKGQSNEVC